VKPEIYSIARLDIMVLYAIFSSSDFRKYSFDSKPKILVFGFTDTRIFRAKMCQKYVFHLCEAHIPTQLDIMVFYTILLDFKKYIVLAQNPKTLAFGFTKKTCVCDENWPKIYIISM
jgi:hypothetical protein